MSGAGSEEVARSAVPIPDLSALDAALQGGADDLKKALTKVRPADLGRELSRRGVDEGRRIFDALDDRHAAQMILAAHPAVAANVISGADPSRSAKALGFLPLEHQTAILGAVPVEPRKAIEGALDEADRKEVERLLAYPASCAARLMSPKVWRVERTATVADALRALRDHEAEIEVAVNCYVVDGGKLVGVAALREVAVADPARPIEEIMTRDPIAVREDADKGDAAEIIQTHDFLSLPVVDGSGRLVGAVRVDDLLDAALSKVGTGFLNQGGVAGKIAGQLPYFQVPVLRVVRSRITWLVLLFIAELATGTVLRHFEDELAKVVALSFFIPLLIGTGGNAGSQTVSTVIRALALGEVRPRDALRVLLKEVSAGFVLGLLLGGIAFLRALTYSGIGYDLAACVAVTVLVVTTWANTVGSLIPLAAQRLGVDPTVISAPLITTLVDASGLFIYLSTAKIMVAQLH
ncbi:MAG: magnesium transporter [Polyangiaceae bacterium]